MDDVVVRRVGTQVVVRMSGDVGDGERDALARALAEVEQLASSRVCVDLEEVASLEGAALDFLGCLHARWRLRLLNAPAGLRGRIPLRAG